MLTAMAPARGLHEIVDLAQYNIPLAGSGIMAERAWLAANRDTAVRFVKAAVDAVALMCRSGVGLQCIGHRDRLSAERD
jgi:hypothetical protein